MDDDSSDDASDDDSSDDTSKLDPVTSNICEAQGEAKCYYAAPNATGTGTIEEPGNLHALLPSLSAGDYLYLFDGVYDQYADNGDSSWIIDLNKYFYFTQPEPTEAAPVTITGYPTHDAIIQGDDNRRCILVDGQSHLVFKNIIVEHCYNEGMRLGWDIPEQGIVLDDVEFREITYNNNAGFVYIQGYEDVVIQNSTFHDYKGTQGSEWGNYLQIFQAIDVEIKDNYFYGKGGGIYYKHGESETNRGGFTKVHGNRFENLTRHGIYTNQNRTEIYDNLFINTDGVIVHQEDGTRPPFTQDVNIHHNTFVDSSIILNQGSNNGSYMDAYGLGAKHATIRNNLMQDSNYRIWVYGTDEQYDEGIDLESNDNCFYNESGSMTIKYFSADSFGEKGQDYNLSGWQSAGYDVNSLEQPLQLDSNYELPAGSACSFAGRR
ncbi:hypothetical protein HF888_01145 [Bermanella marisrubri]|uniref:Right handed beta helix domain-containing protein n=1 Tax=Bermanella marisrubri TaxID=207949 RepID=Q1N4B7_9GAMM|nr:right-handed parallel beta-helix repeat-containing protein [Bermanella marisrubri]EAT12948.1 hypothetical protein RED65_14667 [Oceanobacter sp. RED65] [Bermanella marisrubri]QIZ82923.1 hypothetical protein HF888_01145 [Bermanella marisrubri]